MPLSFHHVGSENMRLRKTLASPKYQKRFLGFYRIPATVCTCTHRLGHGKPSTCKLETINERDPAAEQSCWDIQSIAWFTDGLLARLRDDHLVEAGRLAFGALVLCKIAVFIWCCGTVHVLVTWADMTLALMSLPRAQDLFHHIKGRRLEVVLGWTTASAE